MSMRSAGVHLRRPAVSIGIVALALVFRAVSAGAATCPTQVTFTSTGTGGVLDAGWTGQGHDATTISDATLTVDVTSCGGVAPNCGVCSYTGPVKNGPGQLQAQRCLGDSSIHCTTNAHCGGSGPCVFFFGSYLPFAAGGATACVGNAFAGGITGTVNVNSGTGGAFAGTSVLSSRVFNGPSVSEPCPRCVGDGMALDGVAGGTCSSGARSGLSCDASGSAANPVWGATSLDCPPIAVNKIADLQLGLSTTTGVAVRTLSAASPTCRAPGFGGQKCHCDTCNNAAATPCASNTDCTAVGATTCGGKRCLGGSNNGAACSVASECPSGGTCAVPGAATAPNACAGGVGDCVAGDNAPATSANDRICLTGPVDQHCGPTETFRSCTTGADCTFPGDTCSVLRSRECYGNGSVGETVTASGQVDAPVNHQSEPTSAAVFCLGPTDSAALNGAVGLPGLARLELQMRVVNNGKTTITGNCVELPPDPRSVCNLTTATFHSWFEPSSIQNGAPVVNGRVKAADGIAFTDAIENCIFYEWSEQMFLWATSPAPSSYGGGGLVLQSPIFYDVTPEVAGHRTFVAHSPGLPFDAVGRKSALGPNGFPAVALMAGTNKGALKRATIAEVVPAPTGPSGLPQIATKTGPVEVGRVGLDAKGKKAIYFADQAGTQPVKGKPIFPIELNPKKQPLVQKFINQATGGPVFVDIANRVVAVEQGQAGGGEILMTQDDAYVTGEGSLVYYSVHVNDVYAYFRTGVVHEDTNPGTGINHGTGLPLFPVNATDLGRITTFAAAHGKTFPEPNAMAVELKTAWIRAKDLVDASSFITAFGTIPKYQVNNPAEWVRIGTETAKLAMVGIHVVGSTKGHPEMIWATFEHVCNTPNAAYLYRSTAGGPTAPPFSVPQDTAGDWLFCQDPAPAAGPFNRAQMRVADVDQVGGADDIEGINTGSQILLIQPSDTIRRKAWGGASNSKPNPLVLATADSNSDLIKTNNSVRGMLASADVRTNYILTGATWTALGFRPRGSFTPPNANAGEEVGTSKLTNTTMETYQQGIDSTFQSGTNCFTCHDGFDPNTNQSSNSVLVSHLWETLDPLF